MFHPNDCVPKPIKSLFPFSLFLPLFPTLCSSRIFKTVCVKLSVSTNYISEQTLPTCFLVLIFFVSAWLSLFPSITVIEKLYIHYLILSPKITTYSHRSSKAAVLNLLVTTFLGVGIPLLQRSPETIEKWAYLHYNSK